jgi:hypothetical protein
MKKLAFTTTAFCYKYSFPEAGRTFLPLKNFSGFVEETFGYLTL